MQNFPEQFDATVNRFPDRLAVSLRRESGADRFTYRQLDAMANAAAGYLFARGVRAGDRCAILAADDPRRCAVYLGILRLGAIAVPLDTACTTRQVRTLLQDCGPRALVTSPTLQSVGAEAAAGLGCVVILVSEATREEGATSALLPPCPAIGADVAVVVYAAGTTGDPQRVALAHEKLLAAADAASSVADIDEHDSTLGLLDPSHAPAQIWSLLLPLSRGAHVVFLETATTRERLRALDEEGITVVCCLPQFLYLIHQHLISTVVKPEPLGRTLFRARVRARRTLQRVGLAVGHPRGWSMRLVITGGSPLDPAIGRDLHGLGLTVVQADVGRVDEQGHLTIPGRDEDAILLSSGTHVYAEHIEAHYERSPFIREVCVIGVGAPGAPFPDRLHAIVVPDVEVLRERRIVNMTELIRYELESLSQSLPVHTRVTGFDVRLEPLARMATGNLKRHEVLKRYQSTSGPAADEASPDALCVNGVEPHLQRLVATIQAILGPGVVVRADSSLELDLGLDSMDRVELLATLERRFGVELPEHVALSAFHVRDLAAAFRDAREQGESAADPSWASLLERIEPTPALHALLERRPLSALALFALARIIVRVLLHPHVEGVERLPRKGPFIISPNHQSYLDPIVIVTVLPLRVYRELFFVGAAEYFQSPLMRRLAAWLNVIPVDPDAYLMPAMQAGAFGLRHGKVLMLFPEGERSIDGGVKKFRKGAAILSRQHRVPIVPAAIDGMFEIWPRTRPLNWRTLLPWSSHRTRIAFGDPLPPSDAVAEQTARLHDVVERMWRGLDTSHRG